MTLLALIKCLCFALLWFNDFFKVLLRSLIIGLIDSSPIMIITIVFCLMILRKFSLDYNDDDNEPILSGQFFKWVQYNFFLLHFYQIFPYCTF